MLKTKFTAGSLLLIASLYYAQEGRVGVNTTTPAATMDVVASDVSNY